MLTCTCDFCGKEIHVPERCIIGDGNEIIRPRLVLKFPDEVVYNKDCCDNCFYTIYEIIKDRLKS